MDLLKPLVRHLTHRYFLRRDGYATLEPERELAKSEYLPLEKLNELRLQRLRSLLQFCQEHNSFYQGRFKESGLDVNKISTLDDLSQLPIMTKENIRTASNDLFSNSHRSSH